MYKIGQGRKILNESLREEKAISLREVAELYGDDYDYDETILEDYAYDDANLNEADYSTPDGSQDRHYKPGDVVTTNSYSGSSKGATNVHYIMVIDDSREDADGNIEYRGYLISTRTEKANKYNDKFPNNLYIDNTRSIFQGRCFLSAREGLIRVDDIVYFTSEDIVPAKAYKGHVNTPFWRFVNKSRRNYDHRQTYKNKHSYWEHGGETHER